jgi:3-hydroxy-3-methylglutaryl CoA synthase
MQGITAYGAYIPRARMNRKIMAEANAWFDGSLRALAKGQRSFCNWDEDAITMAVEAAQDCLGNIDRGTVRSLTLASTTLPFLDRQNSVVVGEALNLQEQLRSMDVTSSQRAATSALLLLLDSSQDKEAQQLLIASEHRRSKAGSRQEMLWGDAAAAVCVGNENVIAEFLGSTSIASDFVDHYRSENASFDYDWEERWIRDEGYMKSVPSAVGALLQQTGIKAADIAHFILPSEQGRTPEAVAKQLGIAATAIVDNLIADCGVAGAAQPLLLLAGTLERAKTGELILLTGFGQGCDALLFRVTAETAKRKPPGGVSGNLASSRVEDNYYKFLSFNNLVERDIGKRGETDKQTYLSGFNRRRDLLTAFVGGKCRACGTVQIPREKYCVNPDCNALDSQDDYPFSSRKGRVKTWTADSLTFDWNPPAYFGMVEFDGGGRLMMDFTEVEAGKVDAGTAVTVHFRIKQIDSQRGFKKYFWKAIPSTA